MNILVIAPHADDEVLGCGASIARHVESGDSVVVAIMTNAAIGAPELFSENDIDRVRMEARSAHRFLGVRETVFFDFPAPCLDQYPQYKISEKLSVLISNFLPDTVYVPHAGDIHCDHGVVFRSALVACRPFANSSVKNIYAYETLSETEWASPYAGEPFSPNHFIDVSNVFHKKLDAMRRYESQLRSFPHPRSLDAIDALSMVRGSTISVRHAEAFVTIRTLIRA